MMIVPKPLKPGDTIALIGVSGCIRSKERNAEVEASAAKLTALGFKVKVDPTCCSQYGYLSGTDAERAAAFNRAFADDSVDGVWCIRGGYGCIRLMDLIDWTMVSQHPKAFIGYSDITTLHSTLHQRCGFCTFHGPMPKTDSFEDPSLSSLMHAIQGEPDKALVNPDGTKLKTLVGGVAEGELVGGNLTLVTASVGTPYDLDVTGRLLFLEDVGEHTYSLDRYFQQLYLAGKLTQCVGIVLGGFTDCEVEYPEYGLTLDEVLHDVFSKVHVPVVAGLQAGHLKHKLTLPLGRRYRLDADKGTITLVE